MKKTFKVLLIIISLNSIINGKDIFWTNSTAETMEKGYFEIGIFNSLKYGLTKDIQLETSPINFFYMPNLKLRKKWLNHNKVILSTEHFINYPTIFLNLISKNGIGGILPPTTEFPNFVLFDNSVLATFGSKIKFTTYAGLVLSIGGINNKNLTIDYPLIYPRLSAYYNKSSVYYGVATNFNLSIIKIDLGFKMFVLPEKNSVDLSHLEQKTVLSYQFKNWILFDLGYIFSTGDYPYGKDTKIFPIFDTRFRF